MLYHYLLNIFLFTVYSLSLSLSDEFVSKYTYAANIYAKDLQFRKV